MNVPKPAAWLCECLPAQLGDLASQTRGAAKWSRSQVGKRQSGRNTPERQRDKVGISKVSGELESELLT